jgi:hypothetical protein
MGEIAIALIEQGIGELILHETNQCDGMCSFCIEEGDEMGCYMNGFGEKFTGKAKILIENHGAVKMQTPKFIDPDSGKVAVCVVANEQFEAAAVAFSQKEFDDFIVPDERHTIWLSMDVDTVKTFAEGFDDYVATGKRNDKTRTGS